MNFYELAKGRYSCRKFKDEKVSDDKIDYILKCANVAPTAVNYQPHRIYVIKSDESLAKVSECTKYAFNAPLNFLVCYDSTQSWKRGYDGNDAGEIDASIVMTHMMIAAHEEGLGTTWVGSFNPRKVSEIFALPENIIPVAFMPTGIPDAEPAPMHNKRKTIDEFVTVI